MIPKITNSDNIKKKMVKNLNEKPKGIFGPPTTRKVQKSFDFIMKSKNYF